MNNQEHQFGLRHDELDRFKGSVPLLLAPIYLLFRPGRFVLGYGYHASILIVLIAAWIGGSSAMTNSVVNRARANAVPDSIDLTTWGNVFLLLFTIGIARGLLQYVIGTAWFMLCLRICGIRGNQWRGASRIFCFSRLIELVPLLLGVVYYALRYTDLYEAIQHQPQAFLIVGLAVMMITPVTQFVMVQALYRTRLIWSVLLFLMLPYMIRFVFALIALVFFFTDPVAPLPNVKMPQAFSSQQFTFQYPRNWEVIDTDPNDYRIDINAKQGSAILTLRVMPIDGSDIVETSLAELRDQEFVVHKTNESDRISLGSHTGYGIDYELERNKDQLLMFHSIHGVGPGHVVLFEHRANEGDWNRSKLAPMQVIDSLAVHGLSEQSPDLDQTHEITRSWFTCILPGNWEVVDRSHEQYKSVFVRNHHGSNFWCSIFDRPTDISAQRELDTYLKHSLWDDTIEERVDVEEWLGLSGVGVDLVSKRPMLGKQRVRAIYLPLEDGRVVGIRIEQLEADLEISRSGFQLIEDTFRLRGVEPAAP